MANNQKSKKASGCVEERAKAGMGQFQSTPGMKGKALGSGSYRQLATVRKKYLDVIWSAIEGFWRNRGDCISYGNAVCAREVMMKIREMQEVAVKNVLTGGGLNPFVWCSVDEDGVATERLPEHFRFSQSAIL